MFYGLNLMRMNSINSVPLFSPVLRVCSSDWTRKSVSMSLPGGGQETTGNSRTGTALALTQTGQGSPAPPPSPPCLDQGTSPATIRLDHHYLVFSLSCPPSQQTGVRPSLGLVDPWRPRTDLQEPVLTLAGGGLHLTSWVPVSALL